MDDPKVHQWFVSTRGITITSHDGMPETKSESGTLAAYHRAHDHGYRWFQVDVIPIKDDLISHHAVFGRRFGFWKKTLAEVRKSLPNATTLSALLADEKLEDAYWNIEIKSKKGLGTLLEQLEEAQREGRDLGSIMISSPMRPSVLKHVNAKFGCIALAAPVVHGGVFGVRFLGKGRATVGGRPYDCQQVWYWFVRSQRSKPDRPLRHAWTIRSRRALHRMAAKGVAHMVVDSEPVALPRHDRVTAEERRTPPKVAVLALGGGGWRGAFGGIGAVMYFAHMKLWRDIGEVVGISGGSFAVAALAEAPKDGAIAPPRDIPPHDPRPAMRDLFTRLVRAGQRMASIIGLVLIVVVPLVALFVVGLFVAWKSQTLWVALLLLAPLIGTSMFLRALVTARWKLVLRVLFGTARMRTTGQGDDPDRRYRIGATGLNDGNLYSYTSDPAGDRQRRKLNPILPTTLGGHKLSAAVLRATSLPGVGQLGVKSLYVCDHDASQRHETACVRVPDRLVDGGISSIFGRGLVEELTSVRLDDDPRLVVIDAGRSLQVNSGRTIMHRTSHGLQRVSAVALLARWLMVAIDVAYRGELGRVKDGAISDGYVSVLVRLAEDEPGPPRGPNRCISQQRQDDLDRLHLLRDQVHKFSLTKASRAQANRAVTVAVAACALECEEEPNIAEILHEIGKDLGPACHGSRVGGLADVWKKLPLLGDPVLPAHNVELGPREMLRA